MQITSCRAKPTVIHYKCDYCQGDQVIFLGLDCTFYTAPNKKLIAKRYATLRWLEFGTSIFGLTKRDAKR
jgi:hypothetical protein